ncbi:MAG: ABC transporter permease [Pseudomonadota bacterium]
MFRNYLAVTLRSLLGNKLFSFINVVGLAVGLASVMLIGLYVADELGYDRYHDDTERLFRVSRDFYPVNGSEELLLATNAAPAAELLQADFPEVEATARAWGGRVLLIRDDVEFYNDAVQFVDPALLQMFHFEWVAGDPATALSELFSIVLTESTARRYFGDDNPVGATLELENARALTVTGVIRDLPHNTHLNATAFAPLELVLRRFGEQARSSWSENVSFHTYVKLAPGASMQTLQEQFSAFVNRHIGEGASQWTGLSALPVTDIHLRSTRQFDMKPPGSMANVLTLITVAIGILLIACFNFMNLATAVAAMRGREVGVRKSVGARRAQLVWQFLAEAFGMTVLATLVAVVIVELLMPAFNGFTGKSLAFDVLSDRALLASLLVLVAIVGGGAGVYPAFYLSAFNPATVLRRMGSNAGGLAFRNVLVVLQFSISIALVIATATVLMQTRYARERDPGFTRDQLVILGGPPSQGLTPRWETLKTELLTHPDVLSVTASSVIPGQENANSFSVRRAGDVANLDFPLPFQFVDYAFFETYQVPLLSGRTFTEAFPADRITLPAPNAAATGSAAEPVSRQINTNFILNASAARDFGWSPDTAVEQELELVRNGYTLHGRVVGVVADSNFESVHFNVKPLVFMLAPSGIWADQYPTLNSASIRISGNNAADTLAFIDSTWEEVLPEFPVARSFLSERMDALYSSDIRLGQLYSYFSVLAILIASLGLFGLATFNAQRRTKEIGVRKVMGSSVWGIVVLLTSDFSRLVLLSNLIAWPVAYFVMNRWLENFAYRIDLTPLVFVGSGLIALCIAWVTVGGTAAKAASQKPVLALRYE